MTRDELLADIELDVEEVKVGKKTYYVRSVSAKEVVDFDATIKSAEGNVGEYIAIQLSTFISDARGKQLLSVEDARRVALNLKAETVKKIISAGMRLNGMGPEAQEAARGN